MGLCTCRTYSSLVPRSEVSGHMESPIWGAIRYRLLLRHFAVYFLLELVSLDPPYSFDAHSLFFESIDLGSTKTTSLCIPSRTGTQAS